jgi:CBS domain-containing protein
MEARDIMTTDVITLSEDMTIEEATDLLLRYRIHGAPVTTPDGQLRGMVSFMDLARRAGEDVRVADIMTPDPVVAQEDTPVEEVARLMLDQMVRRVPIVRAGTVVGIVSASDIVQLFLNLHEAPRRRDAGRTARRDR